MSRVALAQMTSTDDIDANLACARTLLHEAATAGVDLIAYPEVFPFIGPRPKKLAIAQSLDGPIVSSFRDAAARTGMMILLGSLHERTADTPLRVHNTSVLIGSGGEILATYRKLKLFDLDLPDLRVRESETIAAGDAPPPVVATSIGRIALTICFDMRFSEIYRDLYFRGAEVVFVPSNFTAPTGAAHWHILLRARAIESQVYVLAPAQSGQHSPEYRSYGHTLAVDPWGEVLAELESGVGLAFADLDLDYLREVRGKLPMG